MSLEIDLMRSPRAAYAAVVREPAGSSWIAFVRRPALVAVAIGLSVSIAATGRASPALVAGTTLTWSYVVLLQLAIALPLIATGARRTVGLGRAVDLFFAGHAPWSLFLLTAAAWAPSPAGRPLWPLGIVVAAPVVLTVRIVSAFFLEVFRVDPPAARRLTIVHQALTWTVFAVLLWWTSALTPRAFELLGLS